MGLIHFKGHTARMFRTKLRPMELSVKAGDATCGCSGQGLHTQRNRHQIPQTGGGIIVRMLRVKSVQSIMEHRHENDPHVTKLRLPTFSEKSVSQRLSAQFLS